MKFSFYLFSSNFFPMVMQQFIYAEWELIWYLMQVELLSLFVLTHKERTLRRKVPMKQKMKKKKLWHIIFILIYYYGRIRITQDDIKIWYAWCFNLESFSSNYTSLSLSVSLLISLCCLKTLSGKVKWKVFLSKQFFPSINQYFSVATGLYRTNTEK